MNVFIVGASSSIGKAAAHAFEAAGHGVLTFGHGAIDFADAESVERFINDVRHDIRVADCLLILSGVLPGRNLLEYSDDLFDAVMKINFVGPAKLVRDLLPHMKAGAQILLMSSVSGLDGSYDPIYAASKAALIGFVKSVARSTLIRINALAPALIEGSSMYKAMSPYTQQVHKDRERLTTLAELSEIIVACAALNDVNGHVFEIRAGQVHV